MGKADVTFEKRSEAQMAIQQYNGVPLDGKCQLHKLIKRDISRSLISGVFC